MYDFFHCWQLSFLFYIESIWRAIHLTNEVILHTNVFNTRSFVSFYIQLQPAIPDVKGSTNFICYWRIFIIADEEN